MRMSGDPHAVSNMSAYKQLQNRLAVEPSRWLVTGVAGFIGSHLLERLLKLGQHVVGLDNLSTSSLRHLDEVRSQVSYAQWRNFEFIRGDVTVIKDCDQACRNVDFVLHQAPPRSHASANEFLTLLVAARDAKVKHFVYAVNRLHSDSAGHGEDNSVYATSFGKAYMLPCTGLRYANIFGPRQSDLVCTGTSKSTALIPTWIQQLLSDRPVHINADGDSSADFCFIDDAVQANLLAAMASTKTTDVLEQQTYNVASGERCTLNALYALLQSQLASSSRRLEEAPVYGETRDGDVSEAAFDISQLSAQLSYAPSHSLAQGLALTLPWFARQQKSKVVATESAQ
jgi:UDP-N-acetylglucosamine 4-epimerase